MICISSRPRHAPTCLQGCCQATDGRFDGHIYFPRCNARALLLVYNKARIESVGFTVIIRFFSWFYTFSLNVKHIHEVVLIRGTRPVNQARWRTQRPLRSLTGPGPVTLALAGWLLPLARSLPRWLTRSLPPAAPSIPGSPRLSFFLYG